MRPSALFRITLLAGFAAAALNTEDGPNSSKGIGAHVHTVIIAPTQGGVLRFVPFAVNASVGDAITFLWNAKDHTVTKVSVLEICNRTSDASFAGVERNAPFTFTQVVNDTDPMFFYSGTPRTARRASPVSSTPIGAHGFHLRCANHALHSVQRVGHGGVHQHADQQRRKASANWGQNIDLAALPDCSHVLVMENIMYTRSFLRANPRTLKDDGSIDLGGDALKMIPTDMAPVNASSSSALFPRAAPRAAASSSSSASASSKGVAPRRKSNGGPCALNTPRS